METLNYTLATGVGIGIILTIAVNTLIKMYKKVKKGEEI